MAFVEQGARSKLPSIAAVVLVHAAIGYAFISGLAYTVIHDSFAPITVKFIPEPKIPPEVQPPPQPRATAAEPAAQPTAVVTLPRLPEVTVLQLPALPNGEILPRQSEATPALPPAPPPSALASAVRPRGDKSAWITTDDYPPASLRNGEAGTVAISVSVDARGRVTDCQVTGSSGHPALDTATCRIYARRARFAPAVDDGGVAVAAIFTDRVRWQIPR